MITTLGKLLSLSRRGAYQGAINAGEFGIRDIPRAEVTGFHFYSDLDMEMRLSAPDDANASYRNLQILQAYAIAAESACRPFGIECLEMQGQRMHFIWDAPFVEEAHLEGVLQWARNFRDVVRARVAPLAGTVPFHFRIAGDYGKAILLRSEGEDVSESLVSLGNVANRPAKKLSRNVNDGGVPADHIAINVAPLYGAAEDAPARWETISLDQGSESSSESGNRKRLFELANSEAIVAFNASSQKMEREFKSNPGNPTVAPIRRQGIMLRADLDGFSRQVREAMASGREAIAQLVADFSAIMKFPAQFKDLLPSGVDVVMFPWAGDCANMLLECRDYPLERTHLPNTAGLNWHDQGRSNSNSGGTNWRSILRDCKWVVAMAGGDNHGADHGYILTGNVYAFDRTFHVGAGWGWRRSLDAEQADGNRAEETVIQGEDFSALDANYKKAYSDHAANPSLFKVAPYSQLKKTDVNQNAELATSVSIIVPGLSRISAPAPRPHAF